MQNWRTYRNYKKNKNADGSFTYIIAVDGECVEVSREIYEEYASTGRKMEYMEHDLKRDRVLKDANGKAVFDEKGQQKFLPEREVSLDWLMAEDWDFPASAKLPEDAVIERTEIKALQRCLALLDNDERALIEALFYDGLTEREYAKMTALSKTAIHTRKEKILAKLKMLLDS